MPRDVVVLGYLKVDCINRTNATDLAIPMRVAYGEGIIVAIILPFVFLLVGLINLDDTLFLVLLLFGLWTFLSAFLLARASERNFYITWGLVLACLSTVFIISIGYAIALVLVAIIAAVVINISTRKANT